MAKGYGATALTGGAVGAMDAIDGAVLEDGDVCIVASSAAVFYTYRLNATSAAAESSPAIISPDTNPGDKRWILEGARIASLQLPAGAAIVEFSTDGALAGDSDTVVPTEKAVKAYVDAASSLSTIAQIVSTYVSTVATDTTVCPYDDTIPQSNEGIDFSISKAITPTDAANHLKIDVVVNCANNNAGIMTAALFKDAGADAIAAAGVDCEGGDPLMIVFTHDIVAGGVAAQTFMVRVGNTAAGTTTLNGTGGNQRYGGVAVSSITITEYVP